jgi:hypothetical protein
MPLPPCRGCPDIFLHARPENAGFDANIEGKRLQEMTMKRSQFAIVAAAALLSAAAAMAQPHDADRREAGEGSYDGAIVVSGSPGMMTAWDYFFNNPEKYRTMRNDAGEYYKGTTRR